MLVYETSSPVLHQTVYVFIIRKREKERKKASDERKESNIQKKKTEGSKGLTSHGWDASAFFLLAYA